MITTHQPECPRVLLEGLRRNDARIIRNFYDRVYRMTYRSLAASYGPQHRETFADCFSQAFLILLRKIRSDAVAPNKLEAFAFGIVRYTFWDAVRRSRRRELPTAPEDLPEVAASGPTQYSSAGEWLATLDHPQLLVWFEGLSDRQQRLLDLRLQGYKLREIAELTGLAHGTLRNVLPELLRRASTSLSPL